ncbi:MAG: PAM68 family protein [Pseudanabaena sp.]
MSKSKESRIPFEPNNRNKKAKDPKKASSAPVIATKASANVGKNISPAPNTKPQAKVNSKRDSGIPDEVNRRIARRVAVFCGIPTGLGLTTFVVSYFLVSKHIVDLPTSAVVLLSMLFLGIGVVGLSYGAISASWDEGRVGSWWGADEFKTNFGHLREAWRSQQQLVKASQVSKKD